MNKVDWNDLIVMAKTVYGEARGEPIDGKYAVACVIRNRFKRKYRGKKTLMAVCMDPKQFSCWNEDDPNFDILHNDKFNNLDHDFWVCLNESRFALWNNGSNDPTKNSLHYHAKQVSPKWTKGKLPVYIIGNHMFYNDIE